jgi:plastocyanin
VPLPARYEGPTEWSRNETTYRGQSRDPSCQAETMGRSKVMRTATKLTIALMAVIGLGFTGTGAIAHHEAHAATAINADSPTITITPQSNTPPYMYSPAQLNAKAGQPITIKNNDENGVHSVTAKDHSFSVDVPPKGTVTLTVPKAGSFPYYCTYHPDEHNQASINAS